MSRIPYSDFIWFPRDATAEWLKRWWYRDKLARQAQAEARARELLQPKPGQWPIPVLKGASDVGE